MQIGLRADRAELDERVEARVDRMWEQGLVEEVSGLARQGLRRGRTAARAVGYAQILAAIDGDEDLDRAIAATRPRPPGD